MMHFSCDLCGKEIRSGDDQRFVIKIEAFAAQDPGQITEADLDEDHMEEVSQLLRDMEDGPEDQDVEEACKNFRFDLCPDCHKRFVRDPLGKEQGQKLFFSKN
jgi:hypothetical protein